MKKHSNPDELTISVVEAGRRLGIGEYAAYQAVNAGQIPAIKLGKRLWRVPLAAFERMLETAGQRQSGK